MKIRVGFVSNSSSSSFVIYGTSFETSELIELLVKNKVIKKSREQLEKFIEDGEEGELISEAFEKSDIESFFDYENSTVYIGNSPFEIKDNETGKEFKERTEQAIEKMIGKRVELYRICETIYN